eukprot:scpid66714/ scgid21984/ Zinc finger CCCH domain-containing protein 10
MDDREREGDGRGSMDKDISKVCRNYLRGTCSRGTGCSFRHLGPEEIVAEVNTGSDLCRLIFCRDFQKSSCRRPNCRLLHATTEEEVAYRRTGKMPPRIVQVEALGGTVTGTQGYMQSMYASALAAHSILPVAADGVTGVAGVPGVAAAMPCAPAAPAVMNAVSDGGTVAGKRTQDLELEVKGLQSLNRSLLEENLTLKNRVSELEGKLEQSSKGQTW